ncbi:MAG: hypothetical protein QXJ07_03760 [Candidatus Bathyarchaeia archaeon]
MVKKLLSNVVILALLMGMFASIAPTRSSPARRIYLSPSNNFFDTGTAYVGFKFNVTVWTEIDTDVGGANIKLVFNDDILMVTRWICPHGDPDFFMPEPPQATELPASPDPGYVHVGPGVGYVLIAVSKGGLPPTAPWGHSGKIAIFEFKVKEIPLKLGMLECVLNINNADTYLLDPEAKEIPDVKKEDGLYRITWARPGPARMGVKPKITHLGPFPPSVVGQTVDIGVYIENLDIAWYLTSANFKLYFNATVANVTGLNADVTWAPIWGTREIVFTFNPIDKLDIIEISVSDPSKTPGGSPPADELICSIKFTIMMQGEVPAVPAGWVDVSPLNFEDVKLYNHVGLIDIAASNNGKIEVEAIAMLPMPFFKVVDPTDGDNKFEFGPAPVVGKEFYVHVVITGSTPEGLHPKWYLIGFQFRLLYNDTLLQVVSIEEGPFLKDGPWNIHGTFFMGSAESNGVYGPHVMVGCMLLSNPETGQWDMTTWPNGTGVLVKIRFRVIYQDRAPCTYTGAYKECGLGLIPLFAGGWAIDRNGNYIPIDEARNVNGTYRIIETPSGNGRIIDLYGGANNAGYGVVNAPFPAPYGGQGMDKPMDMVIPQSEVYLFARVTYNCGPVPSQVVGFSIEGPFEKDADGQLVKKSSYKIWAKLIAVTNGTGIASLVYRMPWPYIDPYSVTGIWKITATCKLYDQVIVDTMIFYYGDLVQITKVTTDKHYYAPEETVKVKVEYASCSMQMYNALFVIVITDEVGVPIDMAEVNVKVGGTEFCKLAKGSFTVELLIPKWAAVGFAYIHVNCFGKDPTEGGFALCPEYTPPPEIYIIPG